MSLPADCLKKAPLGVSAEDLLWSLLAAGGGTVTPAPAGANACDLLFSLLVAVASGGSGGGGAGTLDEVLAAGNDGGGEQIQNVVGVTGPTPETGPQVGEIEFEPQGSDAGVSVIARGGISQADATGARAEARGGIGGDGGEYVIEAGESPEGATGATAEFKGGSGDGGGLLRVRGGSGQNDGDGGDLDLAGGHAPGAGRPGRVKTVLARMPTDDPTEEGVFWIENGVIRVSLGALGTGGSLGIPQRLISGDVTTEALDANKHILHNSPSPHAATIDSDANVPFPVGTTLVFVNANGAGNLTIGITDDTLRLAGTGATGARTLAENGIATALKVAATEWIISGHGLT